MKPRNIRGHSADSPRTFHGHSADASADSRGREVEGEREEKKTFLSLLSTLSSRARKTA